MRHRFAVGLVVPLLLLIGCGDSGDDSADRPRTTVGEADAPTPAEPADTAADADDDAAMSPENCPQLVAAISGAANAAAGSIAGTTGQEFPIANMRELADRIPEIGSDLEIVADALEEFYDRLEELGVDLSDPTSIFGLDPAALEELNAAAEALEEGEVGAANDRVQAFFERECS